MLLLRGIGALALAALAAAHGSSTDRLVELLGGRWFLSTTDTSRITRELVGLPADQDARLIEALAAGRLGDRPLSPDQVRVLTAGLAGRPWKRWSSSLELGELQALAGESSMEGRTIRLLGLIAAAAPTSELDLLAELGATTESVRVVLAYELALDHAAARHAGISADVLTVLLEHGGPLRRATLRSVARRPVEQALVALGGALESASPQVALELLAQMQRLAPEASHPVDDAVRAAVRGRLDDADSLVMHAASATAAALNDTEAVEDLIEVMRFRPQLAGAAAAALRKIAGAAIGPDADVWSTWFAGERAWYESRWSTAVDVALGPLAGRSSNALVELLRHPLFADRSAAALANGLVVLPDTSWPALLSALEALGSRASAAGLAEARATVPPEFRIRLDELIARLEPNLAQPLPAPSTR